MQSVPECNFIVFLKEEVFTLEVFCARISSGDQSTGRSSPSTGPGIPARLDSVGNLLDWENISLEPAW